MYNITCIPEKTKGRKYKEKLDKSLDCYNHDLRKIFFSAAFRRLQYKTQVFDNFHGDYYRTRLTHSLEVSEIAKIISHKIDINHSLSQVIALSHDLGHPPFGHAGEHSLNKLMKNYGGFNHNIYALKIVTYLEKQYMDFDGLNLTFETLDGLLKHNGPIDQKEIDHSEAFLKTFIDEYQINPSLNSSLEAQAAAIADDIAYNNHDIEDGLRAGLFSLYDLEDIDIIGDIIKKNIRSHKDTRETLIIRTIIREIINQMIEDCVSQTKINLQEQSINSYEDVINCSLTLVNFSKKFEDYNKKIKSFLMENMYRNVKVNRMANKSDRIIKGLFELFFTDPRCLPKEWHPYAFKANEQELARIVCDFIAGMTDRYAIKEYQTLFTE